MHDESLLHLRIKSTILDVPGITAQLGIEPTYGFEKGSRVGRHGPIRDSSVWVLECDVNTELDMSTHIENLLASLQEANVNNLECELMIKFCFEGDNSSFFLPRTLLSELNRLNMGIFVDAYHIYY